MEFCKSVGIQSHSWDGWFCNSGSALCIYLTEIIDLLITIISTQVNIIFPTKKSNRKFDKYLMNYLHVFRKIGCSVLNKRWSSNYQNPNHTHYCNKPLINNSAYLHAQPSTFCRN